MFGGKTLIKGGVCADTVRLKKYSHVIGDVVGLMPSGNATLKFAERTQVAGAVVTAGGMITGLNNVNISSGRVDTGGTAPELDDCANARTVVTAKQLDLSALAASPGLALARVKVKGLQTQAIPAIGDLGPGQAVIRIAGDLSVGKSATLAINGAPETTTVVVHVLGKLSVRGRGKIVLNGLTPAQVIYVVDGAVAVGGYAKIAGTILGAKSVTLYSRSRTDGAVFGRTFLNPRSWAVVNRQPWIGWCD